jgi:hypothetical protein
MANGIFDEQDETRNENAAHAPVTGELTQFALDRAHLRSNELYRMIMFLRQHDGECIGDHPDWIAGMDKLLDGHSFDALTELKR